MRTWIAANRQLLLRGLGTLLAVGLIFVLGGFIFYNTNVLNEYVTADDVAELRAEYERLYGHYEGIPQPRLTGTSLNVEIYPQRRAVEIRGTYTLLNGTGVGIDTIHVATVPGGETSALAFNRTATHVVAEDTHAQAPPVDGPVEVDHARAEGLRDLPDHTRLLEDGMRHPIRVDVCSAEARRHVRGDGRFPGADSSRDADHMHGITPSVLPASWTRSPAPP